MSDGVTFRGGRPTIPSPTSSTADTTPSRDAERAERVPDAGVTDGSQDSFVATSDHPGAQGGALRPSGGADGRADGTFDPIGIRGVDAVAASQAAPLPARVPLGVNTIHRFDDARVVPSHIATTLWVPLPSAELPGEVRDMNAKPYDQRYPDRFVVGDGGTSRCFIGVDKRPGSALAQKLDEIIAQIPRGPDGHDPAQVIDWLRRNVNDLIKRTPGSSANDGRPEFPWDKAISVDQGIWDQFRAAGSQQVGDPPLETGEAFPVVPFESYLEAGEGYCIQKALLAALVLDKLGVPSKLEHGAVAQGPGSSTVGHSWVRLEDGRILDAAWSQLKRPGKQNPHVPEQFMFGWSYRMANQRYPYLAA